MHIWTLVQRKRGSSFLWQSHMTPVPMESLFPFPCSLCRELFPSPSANPALLSSCLARLSACSTFGWKWTITSDRLACALAESSTPAISYCHVFVWLGTKEAKTLWGTKGASLWLQEPISAPPVVVLPVTSATSVQATNFWFPLSTCAPVVQRSVHSVRQGWWNFLT